jgi:NAD(P)-dependent dehydrogenase (short-subunit alcohol dehydrogenase family)
MESMLISTAMLVTGAVSPASPRPTRWRAGRREISPRRDAHPIGSLADRIPATLSATGRPGLPEAVAERVVWLASVRAGFVTGPDRPVDSSHLGR